jgi:hypothetical protein
MIGRAFKSVPPDGVLQTLSRATTAFGLVILIGTSDEENV